MKLVVVDDLAVNRRLLTAMFEAEGHITFEAADGIEALDILHREKVDGVVSDILMPRMDGYRLCYEIRTSPLLRSTPIVIYTSTYSTPKDEKLAFDLGADKYVGKPSSVGNLLRALHEAIGMEHTVPQPDAVRKIESLREFSTLLVVNLEEQNIALEQQLRLELQRKEMLNQMLEHKVSEAEGANRVKSAFLSTMSHEIRTPMNAILGYTQLMSRDPSLSADAKESLRIISRSGEHLLALINDILDMSSIEAGRVELHPVTFHLPGLLDDLAAMFRLRAAQKGLRFEMVFDGEVMPYVVADEGKVRQVLINLLGNAVKFTRRGCIRLHTAVNLRAGGRLWLSALVEDTGSGISSEEQNDLFKPFSQTRRGVTAQEGTGLGLAISRKYARLMKGDITFRSSPGAGSLFRFEMPIERADIATAVRRSAPSRVIAIRGGQEAPRILVADDEADSRGWLITLLTLIGFSVRGAENGAVAVRTWEEWKPHLILMDVHMPVMNGLEATRRITADPGRGKTIIVALTAGVMDNDHITTAQSGADAFLPKPCGDDELLEKLGTLLNIAYDYEETTDGADQLPTGAQALSAERLRQLPLELIGGLRDATSSGNTRILDRLILEVRETEGSTARALKQLADNYEYDVMTRLLEEACLQ